MREKKTHLVFISYVLQRKALVILYDKRPRKLIDGWFLGSCKLSQINTANINNAQAENYLETVLLLKKGWQI